MNVLLFLFLRMILWCFLGAMTLHAELPRQVNSVKRVYYHQGPLTDDLVLYCEKSPVINHIPANQLQDASNQPDYQERYTFFMPLTAISQKNVQMINGYSDPKGLYTISLQPRKNPIEGYQCVVNINKEKIGFQVEVFTAITGDHAITFKFVKRDNLHSINNKSHPIIRVGQIPVTVKKNFTLS